MKYKIISPCNLIDCVNYNYYINYNKIPVMAGFTEKPKCFRCSRYYDSLDYYEVKL